MKSILYLMGIVFWIAAIYYWSKADENPEIENKAYGCTLIASIPSGIDLLGLLKKKK